MTMDTSTGTVQALIADLPRIVSSPVVKAARDTLAALLDERDGLAVLVSATAELHKVHKRWNSKTGRDYCAMCSEQWPCQSARLLDDDTSAAKFWKAALDGRIADANAHGVEAEAEVTRLTAKLDAVKAYADDRAFHARGHLKTVNSGRIADDLRAILASGAEANKQ